MTSTGVNVGFSADKNSSRVLRPPGGGHTDIFGAPDPPVKKDTGRNASSILEGTNSQVAAPSPKKEAAPQPPQKAEPPAADAAPARTRVPPGGFSSGLW
ncbi:uncharacterized protein LOC115887314 [Sitophilus oryzae]|uniref:Microtubule-associated protein Jupiter n=1 Tax=Sitophilus oryzae TaxID=7048 RepID=A0A6J2YH22_SITOR|nr:uncharacterized protein LOC115887314 [Sitophilus oryzae]